MTSSLVKTGVHVSARRLGTPLRWSDVLGAVQDSAERSGLVRLLADAGFSADSFANINDARVIVCSELTRYEDRLEGMAGKLRAAERSAVRVVRRRLESELWP